MTEIQIEDGSTMARFRTTDGRMLEVLEAWARDYPGLVKKQGITVAGERVWTAPRSFIRYRAPQWAKKRPGERGGWMPARKQDRRS